MYTLKSIAQRGTLLGVAAALVAATVLPAAEAFADALNPLTDRSLTLSSSSPGWDYTDGSGNATYAQPNSGANGQKTGNTFSFKVSTDTNAGADKIKAFTFQYCTTPAGNCVAPGNNGFSGSSPSMTRNADSVTNRTSDLNIAASSPTQIGSGSLSTYVNTTSGAVTQVPTPASAGTNFIVMYKNGGTWTSLDGWNMTAHNAETGTVGLGTATGKTNQIELVNNSNATGLPSGAEVKVIFFGKDANYITNPGSGAFFVKINTYHTVDITTPANPVLDLDDVIDGGVTVANVMNQSIHITTKVLETMAFSVGTVDPNTLSSTDPDSGGPLTSELFKANGNAQHGTCDPIARGMNAATSPSNTLQLGDENGEFSLDTNVTYSTHSYWRLSSNSSAGATVYYSGVTLSNTVGDDINAIGTTAAAPLKGTEQFGLAIANGDGTTLDLDLNGDTVNETPSYAVNYGVERGASTGPHSGKNYENGADNATNGIHATVATDNPGGYHTPRLYPLAPTTGYNDGAGVVNADYNTLLGGAAVDTSFAFDSASNTIPAAIATENDQVVDCVTAKMRYIANIAATTPAGIYTTKVNYIAAPQY